MDSLLSQDLQPSCVGRLLLNRWPLIFLIGVLGGVVGLVGSWLVPPTYQASAALSIGADPSLARPFSANVQYEADLRTQDLFLSDSTLDAARASLPGSIAGATLGEFRSDLRLDHIDGGWYLRATARTPSDAADRANAWASAADDAFQAAQTHAIKAGEFQALLFSVACAPESVMSQNGSNLWSCDEMSLGVDPDQVSAELLAEARLSHGILPGQVIDKMAAAEPPTAPVRQGRALLALGGTLAGLVLGLLATLSGRNLLGVLSGGGGRP